MITWLSLLYLAALIGMAVYGLLGLVTLLFYWRYRHKAYPAPAVADDHLPSVTVQLPIYNERLVLPRLLDAVARLDYPRNRLQIQVIDDSTDETAGLADDLVRRFQAEGVNMEWVRRENRAGYKAGALAAALPRASGAFLAIFDADFQPPPDFLRRTVPHFLDDARLGAVQARWGHLNDDASPLTAAQAIAMDKHFIIEQTVRHRADLFPKFNGTAGVWRRSCLESCGGWEPDTVCEDLCLSTRAVLQGWKFLFLPDVVAPAELPASINAYKSQQARWAKGSTQCLLKYWRLIVTCKDQTVAARLYALLSMSAYSTHLLLLTLLLLLVPLVALDFRFSSHWFWIGIAGIGQPLLFIMSQEILYTDWPRRLRHFPTMMLLAMGLAASNCRAILQALLRRGGPFVRTPKGDALNPRLRYRLPADWIVVVELGLAVYAGIGLILALRYANYGPLLFLTTCGLGFGGVAIGTLWEQRRDEG